MGLVDDTDLEGEISSVDRDAQAIINSNLSTGLLLNANKCEIITKNIGIIDEFAIFKDFKRFSMEDLTLLGAPIHEGRAINNAFKTRFPPLNDQSPICQNSSLTTPSVYLRTC